MQKIHIIIFLFSIIYISSIEIKSIRFYGCDSDGTYPFSIFFKENLSKDAKFKVILSSPKDIEPYCNFDEEEEDDEERLDYIDCLIADKIDNSAIIVKSVEIDGKNYTAGEGVTSSSEVTTCAGNDTMKDIIADLISKKNETNFSSTIQFSQFLILLLFIIY